VLGKHKIGTMSATNADASVPMGIEARPRFHGPGRNRLPTKKTRMKIGIVNALECCQIARGAVIREYSHKRSNGTNTEQGADSQTPSKDEQQQDDADSAVEPHGIRWRLRALVDSLPVI
jgi:hypothetical protein